MGFSVNASKRALKANENKCEPALNWLLSKAGDKSLELPLGGDIFKGKIGSKGIKMMNKQVKLSKKDLMNLVKQ